MDKRLDEIELRELVRTMEKKLGIIEEDGMSEHCCNISFSQCHTITEIGRAGQTTLNDLAFSLNVDKGAMSRTVKELVKKELVYRNIDENDRRYVLIELTEKGNVVYESIQKNMQNYFKEILNNIPDKKREQVFESLQLLNEAIPDNIRK